MIEIRELADIWPPLSPTKGIMPLRRGSTGPAVRLLQEHLNALGYKVPISGVFGTETDRAVREFQRRVGLRPDGRVGKLTWGRLEKAIAEIRVKPAPPAPNLPAPEPTPPAPIPDEERKRRNIMLALLIGGAVLGTVLIMRAKK